MVNKTYPGGHIGLQNVSFHIKKGEMAFITGRSGAGKSTLLRLTIALDRITSGNLWVGGHSVAKLRRGQIPYFRRNIGVVFQNQQLLFDRSVFDNIALPLRISGHPSKQYVSQVHKALDMVNLLDKSALSPADLSVGQQQRVGLARALVNQPPLILADEPTGNLDPTLSMEIMKLFEYFNKAGVTILIASHDIDLLKSMNYRIITLGKGIVVDDQRNQS